MNYSSQIAPAIDNAKHKVFADALLSGMSATQAAIEAGYSIRSANTQAAQIRNKPQVREYLAYHQRRDTEKALSLKDKLVNELSDMAFFDPRRVVTEDADGDLRVDFSNATDADYKAITKVKNKTRILYDNHGREIGREKQVEVGFADKYRGLELLGRVEGIFKEPDTKVVVDVADRLLRARGRALGSIIAEDDAVIEGEAVRITQGGDSEDHEGGGGVGV